MVPIDAPITSAEAADTLREISTAARKSAQLYGYQAASPHLILWGIIWAIGYGVGTGMMPATGANALWTGLAIAGTAGSFWIGKRQGRHRDAAARSYGTRYLAAMAAMTLFLLALFAVMQPRSDAQVAVAIDLVVALAYTLFGIFGAGARILITGVAIAAITLGGYYWLPQAFAIWMAIAGGGGLILGGLWLRSA